MKRLIKATTSYGQTLREYLKNNADMLKGGHIIIADLTPYPGAVEDDMGYIDCPGVLCDCSVDEILNSPVELYSNDLSDNYLIQDDLDRCIVKDVHPHSQGYTIIVEGF